MIYDTDVLIAFERGSVKALDALTDVAERAVSIITYMELLQGARNAVESQRIKMFLTDGGFDVLPLTENIGHRASIYIEQYARSSGLRAADAIIAATAVENNLPLISGNKKHYKPLKDLQFRTFHHA